MSKIAIAIALLPPDDVMDICVDLCNTYRDSSGSPPLNNTGNLPHISLFFGTIEENQLENLYTKIEDVIKDFKPIETSLEDLTKITRPVGYSSYFLQI